MYRCLLFDLDGTLTNPKEGITRCVQYALHSFGIEEPDLDRLEPFIGPPLRTSFMEFYGFTPEQADRAIVKYRERFENTGIFENEVLDGIPQMLERLREKDVRMAVASSKPEYYCRRILDHFSILSWFDDVVGPDMSEALATKAEVIGEAFRRLGIAGEDKKEVLMIGDRRHDVEGAHACGIACLGIYTGFAPEGELEKAGADYVVRSVAEMEDYLLSNV